MRNEAHLGWRNRIDLQSEAYVTGCVSREARLSWGWRLGRPSPSPKLRLGSWAGDGLAEAPVLWERLWGGKKPVSPKAWLLLSGVQDVYVG